MGSKAAEALRAVVFDKRFLANLDMYTTFRHTGTIETFNSMLTKYAPKRIAFEYIYFVCRIVLAAIDHNMHLFRPLAATKEGANLFKLKYSKRTKTHHAEPVKIPKEYSYVPSLLGRILQCRKESTISVLTRNIRRERDPKNIAPIIDPMISPPVKDLLVKERYSRMSKT